MKTKSRGGSTSVSCNAYVQYNNGTPSLAVTGTYVSNVDECITSYTETPNFHERVRRGDLIPMQYFNQYERWGSATTPPQSDIRVNSPQFREWWTPNWNVGITYYAPTDTALLDIVKKYDATPYVQQAAGQFMSSGFDVLTFIGEWAETRRMFEKTGKRILDLCDDAIRNRNVNRFLRKTASQKGAVAASKAMDSWLESRYGWRPLLYSAQDLKEAIETFNEKFTRVTKRSGVTNTWSEVYDTTIRDDVRAKVTCKSEYSFTSGIRGIVTADFRPASFTFNLVKTGWELITFSHIVDWFLSVGNAIDAASFLLLNPRYTSAGGFMVECNRTSTFTQTAKSPNYYASSGAVIDSTSRLSLRVPQTISFIPQFQNRLDTAKLVDLAAIIGQRVKFAKNIIFKT